ncbi:hypothetical protein BC938DRAFT_482688 [Jimgerdemannia flammicorona]|uniref:Uncharacterized protein n=1 Tax=Jimgerdemannia flammicorona TaxID=994334 RepID=A0A433QDK6_9FUNG|nr:hypothetical protein BC938DRAFT_482688 [Jimgerdemannia flammicorona]
MGRLEGKTVLISGASAGIGEATAKEFARAGSNLARILTARRVERLESLKKELLTKYPSIKVHAVDMDVRNRSAVEKAIASLPNDLKDVDVLVNNAGLVIGLDKVADVTSDAIDTMIDTNVKGLLYLTQAVLPRMKERQQGHIINIGSVSGMERWQAGIPRWCCVLRYEKSYALPLTSMFVSPSRDSGGALCILIRLPLCFTLTASKHAVDAITRALSLELVDSPLRVTEVNPGKFFSSKTGPSWLFQVKAFRFMVIHSIFSPFSNIPSGMVETEFSVVRFGGDQNKADSVYKGLQPLSGEDVAEIIVFAASRPPHVNIADVLVFPTNQADARTTHRQA